MMSIKDRVTSYLRNAGITIDGTAPYDIQVHSDEFYNLIAQNPSLGAGESYAAGLWDCDRLDELFTRIFRHHIDAKMTSNWGKIAHIIYNQIVNLQTRFRAKKVAEVHYNLGNDLYEAMLGPTMAYSCAYWEGATTLDQAQENKFDLICRKLQIKPEDHVLDIGCGWGMLAKFMAEHYGCRVTGLSISTEQIDYARKKCGHLPIEFHLCDYRDTGIYHSNKKPFDKIVSVGMFEHVGYKNYDEFMKISRSILKHDGLFLLHTIGKNNSEYYFDAWANKYIFPNAMLPSIKLISNAVEDKFVIEDIHNLGINYDKTLMAWHKNFNEKWPSFKAKYGETFFRIWNYYLLFSAGAFRSRDLQLWQIVLSPDGVMGGYDSIRGLTKSIGNDNSAPGGLKTVNFSNPLTSHSS